MSSEHLQIQNIPIPLTPEQRETARDLREVFLPRRGKLSVQCNYSQIEIRLAARIYDGSGRSHRVD